MKKKCGNELLVVDNKQSRNAAKPQRLLLSNIIFAALREIYFAR
jgi:hypothetical protein